MKNEKTVHCVELFGHGKDVHASELAFRPSVYGLIFKGSHVLLVPHWDGYDFPGGGIKQGEIIEEALKREVFEETGLKVQPSKFVDIRESFWINLNTKQPQQTFLFYYLCEITGGELSTEHFSSMEKGILKLAEWIPLDRLSHIKFYNSVDSVAIINKARELKRERFRPRTAVYLILEKDGQTLLSRRCNTGYRDGEYGLISGHIDGKETMRQAMCREALEEANIRMKPEDLNVIHVMHRTDTLDGDERVDIFFSTSARIGKPKIMEPDKCDDLSWFPRERLPTNTIDYVAEAIKSVRAGKYYSEFGWD